MRVYELDGRWVVEGEGGYCNQDDVDGGIVEGLDTRPEPISKWGEYGERNVAGYGWSDLTLFRSSRNGEPVKILLRQYHWHPYSGYSWSERWETVEEVRADFEPPVLGEAYRWAGDGWEPIDHPMAVDA